MSHPIHPSIVHFPIAFYCFELFLLTLWVFRSDETYRNFAFLTFKLGYVAMLLAMAAGYFDAHGINSKVFRHFISAVCIFAVQTTRGFFWFSMTKRRKFSTHVLLGTALLAVILVAVTADLGGDLVYKE